MKWFHKKTRPHRRSKSHTTRRIGRHDTLACEPLESRHLLTAAFDLIGLTALRSDPLYATMDGRLPDGQKIGVAVLDSGVEAEHADLRSNFVVYYDAVKNLAPTTDITKAEDFVGHGTHVSGTAVGSNPEYGVATAAGLVGVRVFPKDFGEVFFGDPLARGLQWVAANWQRYNIRVVNMSLGGPPSAERWNAISYLESVGVTVVSASGNSYANNPTTGVMFPAIVSTLSVGSVWAESPSTTEVRGVTFGSPDDRYRAREYSAVPDRISAFSQRGVTNNQLFAPGSKILSADVRGGTREGYGTSMAAPMVAGAVALLQDAAKTFAGRWLSPSEVRDILRNTADLIVDSNVTSNSRVDTWFNFESNLPETGLTYRRMNVQRAVQFVRQTLSPTEDTDSRLTAAREIPALNGLQPFTANGNIGRDGATVIGVNDVDLFKVTLASPGAITIRVDPVPGGASFDPYLRVFDSAGAELAAANDSSTPYPWLSSPILPVGTYYVGVSSFNNKSYNPVNGSGRANGISQGDYSLSVSLDNPDPNGVLFGAVPYWDWGTLIKNRYSYGFGDIGSDPAPDGASTRIQLGGNDVDMFEVVVPDTGFMNVQAGSYSLLGGVANPFPFDTFLRVFNQAGTAVAWNDNDGFTLDSFVRMPVTRGDRLFLAISDARNNLYSPIDPYKSFSASGGGLYDVTLWFDNGDTNGSAYGAMESLNSGVTNYGIVGMDGGFVVGANGGTDVDFYKFTATANGVFDVVITSPDGSLVPSAAVWTWNPAKGECVLLTDTYATNVRHQKYVNAGETVFVSVTGVGNTGYQWYRVGDGQGGDTGSYAITATLRPESDWWGLADDSAGSPTVPSVVLDQWMWGELGQDGSLYRGSTDGDLFRFVAPRSGKVEFYAAADFEASADTFLRVFNAAGQEIAFNDNVNARSRSSGVVLEVSAGQTYFVGVTGFGNGNMRAYTPNGGLNQVEGSTGSYFLLVSEVPTAAFVAVSSPRQNTLSSTALSFSKSVFGVDIKDFVLTRDGIPVPLTGAMLSGSGSQYTISNLANLTAQPGSYSLSLNAAAAEIADTNGTLLEDSAGVSWVRLATPAPTVTISAITPNPRTTAVAAISVAFSATVTGVDLADFVLTRDGIPVPLSGATLSGSGSQYTLGNLDGVTAAPGTYVLTLQSANSGITNADGVALAGPTSQSWIVLTNPKPTVAIGAAIPGSVTTALNSIDITFSKAVNGFDLRDLSLSLNGRPVSLRAARLVGSGQSWSLTRLSTLTRNLGTYSLTINSNSGITDLGGNELASVTPKTWANAPAIFLSGVPAVSRRNVTSVTIKFNGNVTGVSLNGMTLTLDGQAIPMTGSRVTGRGTTFRLSLPPKLTSKPGLYTLEAGGPGSGIVGNGLPLQARASISWRRV